MDDADQNPLEFLRQLEIDSLGNQLADTEQAQGEAWQGFVFTIEKYNLVVPFLGEFEIYPCGEIASVPMAKSWVRGIANIRGEIYTVVDLPAFTGSKPIRNVKGCNLILLPDFRLRSALLVEGRIGMRSFDDKLPEGSRDGFPRKLATYLSRVVVDGDQHWGVVDVKSLSSADEFLNISS